MNPQELRFAALRECGIVAHDEDPSPEMDVFATDRYTGLHGQLVEDQLATWAIDEDIPAAVQQAMTWLLAFVVAGPLGAASEELQRLASLGAYGSPQTSLGERLLRRYAAAPYVPQPQATDYY